MKKCILLIVVSLLVLSGCTNQNQQLANDEATLSVKQGASLDTKMSEPQSKSSNNEKEIIMSDQAVLKLDKGEVVIKLYPDVAPKTVQNFLQKASAGYYEKLIFHRVEDWVVQGGDPKGNGTGGGNMATELSKKSFKIGSVGVARGGDIKISNDSQFFICTKDCSFLNEQYTIFGEVVEGMEVVNKIEIGDEIIKITPVDAYE